MYVEWNCLLVCIVSRLYLSGLSSNSYSLKSLSDLAFDTYSIRMGFHGILPNGQKISVKSFIKSFGQGDIEIQDGGYDSWFLQ